MPESIIDNNKGTDGDDAAVKAVAEKAAADTAASAAASGNGSGDGEETVIIKKSEMEKLQSDLRKSNEDRDNYKKGLLQKKADERKLKEEGQDGDGDNIIDEKKVGEIATVAANKALRNVNEKTAKRIFLAKHSEYGDDDQWMELMSHLTFKGSELMQDEILDRMEVAVLEHKRATGKLEEYLKEEHERGVREGRIQGEIESGRGTGGAGDKQDGGKGMGSLSPKGEEMARAMHTDPEKVRKVDPSKDNVIDVTK